MEAPRIRSVWRSGPEFLARFDAEARVLHPIEPVNLPANTPVSVDLHFADRRADFHLHALVRAGEPRALAFLEEERDRLELVLTCARGESLPYFKRRHTRYPCDLAARVRLPNGEERDARAIDISEGGTRLAVTSGDWRQDLNVRLSLSFVGEKIPLSLRARIASFCETRAERSVGFEFLFDSAAQRAAVQRAVAKLATR
jgi:hypothetical protein